MLGVILIDHGSRLPASNAAFAEIVRRFAERSGYPIVEPAHMELAPPTLQQAFQRAVERGADAIVIYPYFLLPGRHSQQDIPALCRRAAAAYPRTTWTVAEPLGWSDKIMDVIRERIEAAQESLGSAPDGPGPMRAG